MKIQYWTSMFFYILKLLSSVTSQLSFTLLDAKIPSQTSITTHNGPIFTDYITRVMSNRTNLKPVIHLKIQLKFVVNPIKWRGCTDTGSSVSITKEGRVLAVFEEGKKKKWKYFPFFSP